MATNFIVGARILDHCREGFTSISPLIGELATSSTIYRWKDKLMEKGWLETDGKDRYRTTSQGLLQLQVTATESPKGLSPIYPPLERVPTAQHKAVIELVIAAVIARKYDLRSDRHPAFILAGPTLTWKTSTALFLCYMLGLDPAKQTVNLSAESGYPFGCEKPRQARSRTSVSC